jgi:hypothetical protein
MYSMNIFPLLLFDWPKSSQKTLANFKLAVNMFKYAQIIGSNNKIRNVRLRRVKDFKSYI